MFVDCRAGRIERALLGAKRKMGRTERELSNSDDSWVLSSDSGVGKERSKHEEDQGSTRVYVAVGRQIWRAR